jgi:hypothetical protein
MLVLIKDHKHGAVEIVKVKRFDSALSTVEAWQRATIQYQVNGTLPAITWKVSESNDVIEAMIEGASL